MRTGRPTVAIVLTEAERQHLGPPPLPVRALKSLGIRDYARHCETDVGTNPRFYWGARTLPGRIAAATLRDRLPREYLHLGSTPSRGCLLFLQSLMCPARLKSSCHSKVNRRAPNRRAISTVRSVLPVSTKTISSTRPRTDARHPSWWASAFFAIMQRLSVGSRDGSWSWRRSQPGPGASVSPRRCTLPPSAYFDSLGLPRLDTR